MHFMLHVVFVSASIHFESSVNNELEIMMWSKSAFGDELIGSTTVDIERRMLNPEWAGWNRQHNVPRELRDLHNISSNVSQVTVLYQTSHQTGQLFIWM